MPETLVAREHDRVPLRARPDQRAALLTAARGRFEILATGEPHGYELRTGHHVGTVAVSGLQLLIRPKVPLDNVFTMLGAPGSRIDWQRDNIGFDYGTERHLLPAFASLLSRATARALARGPLRSYRDDAERLPALRGRIDFSAQARRAGIELPVACRYQEFTVDVLENQALRAAIRVALRLGGVRETVRADLRHHLARLEDVADAAVDAAAIDRLTITRLNRHYGPALRLSAILLRSATLATTPGGAAADAFLVDMEKLFEAFVTDRLKRHLRGRLVVRAQGSEPLDVDRRVTTKPDLILERDGRPVLVADVKYKLADDALGRHPDYYQLLAYATLLNLRCGVLIYVHSGSGAPARQIVVRHGGQHLWAIPVRVSGTPRDLEASMAELAGVVWGLAADRA